MSDGSRCEKLYATLSAFLERYHLVGGRFLLALSGGADSMSLLLTLLAWRKKTGGEFHVAHVDHGWRVTSRSEALWLKQWVEQQGIPFHLLHLECTTEKGNLEAVTREKRYLFFSELCAKHALQGVFTGHHSGDLAETSLKRIFEGAHWNRVWGIEPISSRSGMLLLRPWLVHSKEELVACVSECGVSTIDDPTNRDPRFLRSRMRATIFPYLEGLFGKEILGNLGRLCEQLQEVEQVFSSRWLPLVESACEGPWGSMIERSSLVHLAECRWVLQKLCDFREARFSREQLNAAAQRLLKGEKNKRFLSHGREMRVHGSRLFLFDQPLERMAQSRQQCPVEAPGEWQLGNWHISVKRVESELRENSNWVALWQGLAEFTLAPGRYLMRLGSGVKNQGGAIKYLAFSADMPPFLEALLPSVCCFAPPTTTAQGVWNVRFAWTPRTGASCDKATVEGERCVC